MINEPYVEMEHEENQDSNSPDTTAHDIAGDDNDDGSSDDDEYSDEDDNSDDSDDDQSEESTNFKLKTNALGDMTCTAIGGSR